MSVLASMKKRVGVLIGGLSKERPGSLRTGQTVLESLARLGCETLHIDPMEVDLLDKLRSVDCVFVALHGWYGEDGKMQGLLDTLKIPYTGSGVLASAIGMHKIVFKKLLMSEGISTPRFKRIPEASESVELKHVCNGLQFPVIVKPVGEGGSLGITVARSVDHFCGCVATARTTYDQLFVEEFIKGSFITVGVLGTFGHPEVLPVMHIRFDGDVYDYAIKHTPGAAEYIVPADLPTMAYQQAQEYARRVYLMLGCHGPLRIDMICDSNHRLWVLEVNTTPGLSSIGNLPAIAAAAGIHYDDLIERICLSAFNKPAYLP